MVIGSGSWGKKVNTILIESGIRSSVIGAREFLGEADIQKQLDFVDLIWICSTPEMQLKSIKKILAFSETKILIEKPICSYPQINNEITKLIANQNNIFISRPWNFSNLWRYFLRECLSEGEIISIKISHSGDSSRHFMTPPQDWLHHDLCLLEELLRLKNYQNLKYEVEWSEEKNHLDISGTGIISIKIGGGLSTKRDSTFQIQFKNGTKMVMDMIESKYYKFDTKSEAQEFAHTNNDSLYNMVNHFIDLSLNSSEIKDEIEKLHFLDLLAFE